MHMKLLNTTVYLVQIEKKSLKVDFAKKITLGVTIPT